MPSVEHVSQQPAVAPPNPGRGAKDNCGTGWAESKHAPRDRGPRPSPPRPLPPPPPSGKVADPWLVMSTHTPATPCRAAAATGPSGAAMPHRDRRPGPMTATARTPYPPTTRAARTGGVRPPVCGLHVPCPAAAFLPAPERFRPRLGFRPAGKTSGDRSGSRRASTAAPDRTPYLSGRRPYERPWPPTLVVAPRRHRYPPAIPHRKPLTRWGNGDKARRILGVPARSYRDLV